MIAALEVTACDRGDHRPSLRSFLNNMLTEQEESHARIIPILDGVAPAVRGRFSGGFGGNSYLAGFFPWIGASPFSMALYGAKALLPNVFQPIVLRLSSTAGGRTRLVSVPFLSVSGRFLLRTLNPYRFVFPVSLILGSLAARQHRETATDAHEGGEEVYDQGTRRSNRQVRRADGWPEGNVRRVGYI